MYTCTMYCTKLFKVFYLSTDKHCGPLPDVMNGTVDGSPGDRSPYGTVYNMTCSPVGNTPQRELVVRCFQDNTWYHLGAVTNPWIPLTTDTCISKNDFTISVDVSSDTFQQSS